jgi:threonine aldolase
MYRGFSSLMIIDFRSDTVTAPGPAMREAIASATVGDDVFQDDPTVNALEQRFAEMAGKPAALFVASGTMGNQVCLACLAPRATEIICEGDSHIINSEAGAASALWGISVRPVHTEAGIFSGADLKNAWRDPSNVHNPPSSVVTIENTHNYAGGTVWPLDRILEVAEMARSLKLSMHLDGARIWNAMAATGIPLSDWAGPFDTVTACFSKGLGAPAGSMIAGSVELIENARRVRKMLGGGMRQVGVLAAAADFALCHNLPLLSDDHEKCRVLAQLLSKSPVLRVRNDPPETNILFVDVNVPDAASAIQHECRERGILFHQMRGAFRFVTHLDVSMDDVEQAGREIVEACETV